MLKVAPIPKKSRIWKTPNLLTDANSSTDNFFLLALPKGLKNFLLSGVLTFFFIGVQLLFGEVGKKRWGGVGRGPKPPFPVRLADGKRPSKTLHQMAQTNRQTDRRDLEMSQFSKNALGKVHESTNHVSSKTLFT